MYRSPALDHLSSPEDLNALQIVVTRRAWLASLACGVICLAALAWAVFGRIPVTVEGAGVLINPGNVRHVQSPADGQVAELMIEVGQAVNKGDIIARLRQPEIEKQIEQQHATLDEEQKLHTDASKLEAERWKMEKQSADEQLTFLKSEITKARELADAVRERDKEYTSAQRCNLNEAQTISRELQESFRQQFAAFQKLKDRGVATDREAVHRLLPCDVRRNHATRQGGSHPGLGLRNSLEFLSKRLSPGDLRRPNHARSKSRNWRSHEYVARKMQCCSVPSSEGLRRNGRRDRRGTERCQSRFHLRLPGRLRKVRRSC